MVEEGCETGRSLETVAFLQESQQSVLNLSVASAGAGASAAKPSSLSLLEDEGVCLGDGHVGDFGDSPSLESFKIFV